MKMFAKEAVVLPFLTIPAGAEVEVENGFNLFGQEMKSVSVSTDIGMLIVHLPKVEVDKLFTPSSEEESKHPELQKLLDQLFNKSPLEEKPRIKMVNPKKFFVAKPLNHKGVTLDIGEKVEVVGMSTHLVVLKAANGETANFNHEVYNSLVPVTSEKPSKGVDHLKKGHYLKQGFISSGGLLVKRINDTVCQVIHENNLDEVRVMDSGTLVRVIEVDWK